MTSRYPVQIDSALNLPLVVDNFTPVTGGAVNRLREAVINVESELGVKPSGLYGTVRSRLDALEFAIVNAGGGSGGSGSGIMVVADIAERDAILVSERTEAMLVYVLNDGTGSAYYQLGAGLTNSDWSIANFVHYSNNLVSSSLTAGPVVATSLQAALVTINGKVIANGIDTSVLSDSDQGVIYYDLSENKFKVSENGSAYVDLLGSGGGTPGGLDTQIQFNDGSAFGGDAGLTYNKTTNVLSVSDALAISSNPATTGAIRLANDAGIQFRNAANTANGIMIRSDASNIVWLGDDSTVSHIIINSPSSISVRSPSFSVKSTTGADNYATFGTDSTADYLSLGPNPSTIGDIRFHKDFAITARNQEDTSDKGALAVYYYVLEDTSIEDELAVGTHDAGLDTQTYDRVSICANKLAYFWMNNSETPLQVGTTVDGYWGTFIPQGYNLALCGSNGAFVGTHFGGGEGVMYIGDGYVMPANNPVGGVVLYSESGTLKYKQPDGNVITIGGGGATPGGSDTQVQFNDGGAFAGDAGFTYNKTSNVLSLTDALSIGAGAKPASGFLRLNGDSDQDWVTINYSTTDYAQISFIGGALILGNNTRAFNTVVYGGAVSLNTESGINGYVNATSSYPFVSDGLSLEFFGSGTIATAGSGSGVLGLANASVAPTTNPTGGVTIYAESGDLKYRKPDGTIINIGTTGGVAAGSDTHVQFNDGGSFGGDSGLTYNKTTDVLTAVGAFQLLTTSGPIIAAGTGAPASTPANGSIYLRTDGTSTTGLYTRQAGAWSAIGGGGSGGAMVVSGTGTDNIYQDMVSGDPTFGAGSDGNAVFGKNHTVNGYACAIIGSEGATVRDNAIASIGQGWEPVVDYSNSHVIGVWTSPLHGVTRSQRTSYLLYARTLAGASVGVYTDSNGDQLNFTGFATPVENVFLSLRVEMMIVPYPTTRANAAHWRKTIWEVMIHVDDSGSVPTNPLILAGATPILDQWDGDGSTWTTSVNAESGIFYPLHNTGGWGDVIGLCKIDFMELCRP